MIRFLSMVALLLVTTLTAPASPARALEIVTTTTDLASLFREIGGERLEIQALAQGYQDPHYVQAKPSYMARMRDADLLAYVGLELEIGWLPLLIRGARNPDLLAGGRGNLVLSEGIEIRDVPRGEVDRSKGDIHPLGNPHYWLDPHNLLIMAETVEAALARLDPEHADHYERRRRDFQSRLRDRIAAWEERMAPHRGTRVVCYHTQWEYLTDWLGLEVVDYVEKNPGIPPSPRHLHGLESRIEREEIPLILMSNFFQRDRVAQLASRAGATLVVLPASVGGREGVDDLFDLFDHLVEEIDGALEGGLRG